MLYFLVSLGLILVGVLFGIAGAVGFDLDVFSKLFSGLGGLATCVAAVVAVSAVNAWKHQARFGELYTRLSNFKDSCFSLNGVLNGVAVNMITMPPILTKDDLLNPPDLEGHYKAQVERLQNQLEKFEDALEAVVFSSNRLEAMGYDRHKQVVSDLVDVYTGNMGFFLLQVARANGNKDLIRAMGTEEEMEQLRGFYINEDIGLFERKLKPILDRVKDLPDGA